MNYFELYGIPVSLRVDPAVVRKRFYELSRVYHPDFHSMADGSQQAEMLQKSADLNRAYKTFSRADDTIRYVLQMKGLVQDEEKYGLDASFLAGVMEINEQLMELEMEPAGEALEVVERDAKKLMEKIYGAVAEIVENYEEGVVTEKELLRVKDYYYKRKYLQRILDKIAQIRNIASF